MIFDKNHKSWPLVKLKSVTSLIDYGLTASADNEADGPLFLRITDLGESGVEWSQVPRCECDQNKKDRNLLKKGDIVFARTGATTGKSYLITDLPEETVFASYLIRVRSSDDIHSPYLAHFFKSPNYWHQIGGMSSGATLPGVNASKLGELEIPQPPLAEQQRIAAILDKADAIRQKRKQAIKLADDFLRSVYLDMFGDPVTNPKGLKKASITELSDVITGFAFKSAEYIQNSESAVRLCRGANTLTGYFDWKDTAYWEKNKLKGIEGYKIEAGDVILAMDRPWISSGLKVCIFPDNERDTYLVQRVARIRPKLAIHSDYLYACILSNAFAKHCCPTETTVPHISPVELKNFEILIPDESLVQKYHDTISKIRMSLVNMEGALTESTHAFNSLSQKAFSGQL